MNSNFVVNTATSVWCVIQNRLPMAFKIDPGLEKMKIPKFTIQPLVENYFAHGVDHKRKDNVISVKVLVRRRASHDPGQ